VSGSSWEQARRFTLKGSFVPRQSLASSANAYPTDELDDAGEPAPDPELDASFTQTRTDAVALVAEIQLRPYSAYEPGVVVAQKFQLVRMLGEGGMGSVWVAKNVALDVHVALKLIRPDLSENVPGMGERLLQEARAAASIDHPAVIQIFDFGMTELKDPFIAMELLHGESLGSVIKRRGKISPVRAVQTLLPIADALLSAHERGIVHRDLKPDNVFLSRGAGGVMEPKILDFGIAKFEQKLTPNLTSAGTILGSPAYMSPEQARGESDVDGRTDVWALSVVLYEAITGSLPFGGENYNALMYDILEGQPRSFGELGINEPLLWSILLRGLEKDRTRRSADMFEFGRALAVWLLDRGVQEDACHGLLKSKWLERPKRSAATQPHSFFPSDPPDETHPNRTGEHEKTQLDEEPNSGVLVRPAAEAAGQHLFGAEFAATRVQKVPASVRGALARVKFDARSRWVWLTVAGAIFSFSFAVGLAALSGSHEDDESRSPEPRAHAAVEERHSEIPLATAVVPVEMPRPSASALATAAAGEARSRGEVRPVAEVRAASPKPVLHPRVSKPLRNDLKNPFR